MKSFIISSIFLCVIVFYITFCYFFIEEKTNYYLEFSTHIEQAYEEDDYMKVSVYARKFKEEWDKDTKIFYLVLPHDDILAVTFCLEEVILCAEQENPLLTLKAIKEVSFLLDKIIADQVLDLQNLI